MLVAPRASAERDPSLPPRAGKSAVAEGTPRKCLFTRRYLSFATSSYRTGQNPGNARCAKRDIPSLLTFSERSFFSFVDSKSQHSNRRYANLCSGPPLGPPAETPIPVPLSQPDALPQSHSPPTSFPHLQPRSEKLPLLFNSSPS
jgi:hypothetical protein